MRPQLRRHRAALLAVLLAGVAALFVLLAVDIRTWQSTVARDDLRFRALPSHRGLWRPATLLPGDPAAKLIGVGSTIAWRRALQYYWYSRTGSNPEVPEDAPTLRADAQSRVQAALDSAPTPMQRSRAANLLGVLVVTTPLVGQDKSAVSQLLTRAAQYFQLAIALDSTNTNAKENLELVLRLQRPGRGKLGKDARAGYGFGRGQGATVIGSGY